MIPNVANEVLLEENRDTVYYEKELNNVIDKEENAKIKDDMKILEEMGYEKK